MTTETVDRPKRAYRKPGLDPSQCKRRWYSVDPECECADCLPMRRRTAKRRLHKIMPPARSDEAWAAVERMIARGWGVSAIAAAAGIDRRTLSQDRQRQLRTGMPLGRVRAERLIAAEHVQPPKGRVKAIVARRQLQALSALGHSLRSLEGPTGIKWQTLHSIREEVVEFTDITRATAIDAAYRGLSMTVGDSAPTRKRAEKRGWAPPLAWEGHDMADAKARPTGLVKRRA